MTHRPRSPFARRIVGVLSVCAALAACGDDEGNDPDTGYDAGYDTGDVGIGDATPDTTTDVGPDTIADVGPDTIADVTPDTADTTPDADADTTQGPLEILGTYDIGELQFLRIAEEGISSWWYGTPFMSISAYDNDAQWLVGQNTDLHWNPGEWSKFAWVETETGLLWCWVTDSAATEEGAIAEEEGADPTDPDNGCLGGPWQVLTPGQGPIAVRGDYGDDYGGYLGVDKEGVRYSWYADNATAFTQYDNEGEWVVGQNASTDEWNPDLWSKFEWSYTEDGQFYWCQTVFGAESEEAAIAAEAADRTDWETGCGGFPWSVIQQGAAPWSIVGDYVDNYGGYVGLTNEGVHFSWYSDAAVTLEYIDNHGEQAVGQNASTDEWNPDLWSKFEWAQADDDTFYWCQTAFGAETEIAAMDTPPADRTDWETGCGGFPWSIIDPTPEPLALIGDWTDNYDSPHTITADLWTQSYGETSLEFHIDRYSNASQVLIAQNGAENDFAAGLWSRFDWTTYEDALWFCQQVYDAETPLAAYEADAADSTDPSTGGCGGGAPWSRLDE